MLNQSETEFKDYITFFPTTDLADDAQLRVALTHMRQMEKPDRDSTQARLSEIELKRMISDYPDSPLLDEAKQKLRDVQEVLAEGVSASGDNICCGGPTQRLPTGIRKFWINIRTFPKSTKPSSYWLNPCGATTTNLKAASTMHAS